MMPSAGASLLGTEPGEKLGEENLGRGCKQSVSSGAVDVRL